MTEQQNCPARKAAQAIHFHVEVFYLALVVSAL